MFIPYDPRLRSFARALRKQSTLSEILLWKKVRKRALGYEFHRQVPLDRYIVDFYCSELMLAIEIDGWSHDGKYLYDCRRQQRLESFGVRFIRFDDREIKTDLENVMVALAHKIKVVERELKRYKM